MRILEDRLGIYLQDQISLLDNLKLLVGGRFDLFDQRSKTLTNTTFDQDRQRFSPALAWSINRVSRFRSMPVRFNPNIFATSADDIHPLNLQLAINTKLAL